MKGGSTEMGYWNLLKNLNNPEGIREAMRMSYDKHYRLALEGRIGQGDIDPLHAALLGAMLSRFRLSGVPNNQLVQVLVWADLGPFLWLDQATAREAVAEYVVYKERPADARIAWLEAVVRQGCEKGIGDEWFDNLVVAAKLHQVVWLLLYEGRGAEYWWG